MMHQSLSEKIPVTEEELRVGKQSVATGKVRVRTVVDATHEMVRETLESERVEISRVPIGKEVDVTPVVRTEGDVLIVPVLEEVLVVEKRLFLKEEMHIRRLVSQDKVEMPVTVRKQHAVVERLAPEDQTQTEDEVE